MTMSGGPGQGPGDTRNMIIAIVLIGAIMLGSQIFLWGPRERDMRAEQARQEQTQAQNQPAAGEPERPLDRDGALQATASARAVIDTPAVDGSILLQGARFDDLNLRGYHVTVDDTSPEVTLLSPRNAAHGYEAFMGWENQDAQFGNIDATTMWTAAEGARLTPNTPLTLTTATADGLAITRTVSVDENYMLTIVDEVRNTSGALRTLRPFGTVRRQGLPQDYRQNANVHQGFAGVFGPEQRLYTESYANGQKHARERARDEQRGRVDEGQETRMRQERGDGGWLGISDHYWLTALVVDQQETISAYFDAENTRDGYVDFRAAYRGEWREVPAGGAVTYTQRLFAGAKRVDLLQQYQDTLNIRKFDEAVDWGNLMWPLTRPYFNWLLHPASNFAENVMKVPVELAFAIGILLSTVVIKLLLFPLVYTSYKQMAKMRAVMPKQKELMERFAADKQRQQQEIIRLYQTEKVNPVAGCLPMILTIPVFFALYKVLSVTIEMRHAPFVGWIHDMSAPDPTTIFNLFGLLPFNPHDLPVIGAFLMVGVWPILYGASMMALQSLSPPPTDQTQAMIFRFLPIVFTFVFAGFPAGLVIYWVWSNVLTIIQQYAIMRHQGVETQLDIWFKKTFKKKDDGVASPG